MARDSGNRRRTARARVKGPAVWRRGGGCRTRVIAPGWTSQIGLLSPRSQHGLQDNLQDPQAGGLAGASRGSGAHAQNWPISAQYLSRNFLLGCQDFLPVWLVSEGGTVEMPFLGPFPRNLSEGSATFYAVFAVPPLRDASAVVFVFIRRPPIRGKESFVV